MMRLHKFLDVGAVCPVTGETWPLGAWVTPGGALDPSGLGHLVARDRDIAHWAAAELYRAEVEGELREDDEAVIAPRVRLVEKREEWPSILAELAPIVAERTRAIAPSPRMDEYRGDLEMCAQYGMLPHVLLIASVMHAYAADPDGRAASTRAFREERARQSAFILERLRP